MNSRLVLLPAVLIAIWLIGVEVWRGVSPDSPLFGDPRPRSLAQAISGRAGVDTVYDLLRGRDPNEVLTVTDPTLAGDRAIAVSPLVLAAAAGDPDVVQMLLDHGVIAAAPENRVAWCVARDNGDTVAVRMIEVALHGDRPSCPAVDPSDRTSLRRFVAQ